MANNESLKEYLKGVINLRGEVLPVTDTKVKFGMGDTEFTTNTCILVLEIVMDSVELKVGVLVDNVREVFEIDNIIIFTFDTKITYFSYDTLPIKKINQNYVIPNQLNNKYEIISSCFCKNLKLFCCLISEKIFIIGMPLF